MYKEGKYDNLRFIEKDDKKLSLQKVLVPFGYQLNKVGMKSMDYFFNGQCEKGIYLCAINNYQGMSHCIGIDTMRNLIWDPALKRANVLDKSFFKEEMKCTMKTKMMIVQMIPTKEYGHTKYSWLDSRVKSTITGEMGTVIFVDTKDGIKEKNKNVFGIIVDEGNSLKLVDVDDVEKIWRWYGLNT